MLSIVTPNQASSAMGQGMPTRIERLAPPRSQIGACLMRQFFLAVPVVFMVVAPSFGQGHMGTPQEQAACKRDAQRFYRQQLTDDMAVQQCLQQNRSRVSKRC